METGENHILVDPMLGAKGTLPPFAWFRHTPASNPLVSLPENATGILAKVTHCFITHSRTFGIRAFQHTDHLDREGESFLKQKNIPVVCPDKDASYLEKLGLNVVKAVSYQNPEPFLDGEITAVRAQHGRGWIRHLMANGAGFFLRLPGEPSVYISGDTVYTKDVEQALETLRPDLSVVAAGSASLDIGGPILMPVEEIIAFVRKSPNQVMANHMDCLNHCPTTRTSLKEALEQAGLASRVIIPKDGESIAL